MYVVSGYSGRAVPRRAARGHDAAPRALRAALAVRRTTRTARTARRRLTPRQSSLAVAKALPKCLHMGCQTLDISYRL